MRMAREVLRTADDIKAMRVRGAGRIARAAARALAAAAKAFEGKNRDEFLKYMERVAEILRSSRPTAVSLPNAISYVMFRLRRAYDAGAPLEDLREVVISAAEEFIDYSRRAVEMIGEIGSKIIRSGDAVMTHCNSSAALAVIRKAHESGKDIKVYATETRPKCQGYITTRQLLSWGIDVKLIPDSAMRVVIRRVDKVIVGADTVAANGAVVNKVGTSMLALAAKEANVPFYVAAETYKFSPATVLGEIVVIEERSPSEVVRDADRLALLKKLGVTIRNPSFDITPPSYITAIITEKGLIPPQAASLVLKEEYGWAIATEAARIFAEIEEVA